MIDRINARLIEWARWRVADRMLLRSILGAHNIWSSMVGERVTTDNARRGETFVPINDLDCCATDRAVGKLPRELIDAVSEYYCRTGTADMAARELRISRRALFDRIEQAHARLDSLLNGLDNVLTECTKSA